MRNYIEHRNTERTLLDSNEYNTSTDEDDMESTMDTTTIHKYTAIIHEPEYTEPTPRNKCPDFFFIQHGDHIHIIYIASIKNQQRTTNRILKYLNATPSGITEFNITKQKIRNWYNFMAYLVRYGVRTIKNPGNAFDSLIQYIKKFFLQQNIDTTDNNSNTEHCIQYIENKKHQYEKLSAQTRKQTIEEMLKDIENKNITYTQYVKAYPHLFKISFYFILLFYILSMYKTMLLHLMKIKMIILKTFLDYILHLLMKVENILFKQHFQRMI